MTIDGAMSLVALGLAAYAGWKILPRPLVLPWDELFRVALEASAAGTPPSTSDPSIDPRMALGFDWAAFASWSPDARAAIARRLDSIVWVTAGTDVDVPLEIDARTLRIERLDAKRPLPTARPPLWQRILRALRLIEAPPEWLLIERLQAELDDTQRVVFVVGRAEALPLLRILQAHSGLRDYTRAVVLVDPDLEAAEAWIAEHFQHDALDTELNIPITYVVVRASPGPDLPDRPVPRSGARALDVVHLSPVADLGPRPHLERALLVLLAQKSRGW